MNTRTLNGITLETLKNYRTAATQTVMANRSGGHRLLSVVNGALANSVYPRTAKLAPRATVRMNEVRGSLSDVVTKGIDEIANRTVTITVPEGQPGLTVDGDIVAKWRDLDKCG